MGVELMRRLDALRQESDRERGFSLLELVVALGIFTMFIALSITTFSVIGNGVITARSRANSATGVLDVFQTMDRQVRFADAVNWAGLGPSGDAYIEFEVPARATAPTAAVPTPVGTCTQWRYVPANGTIGVPGTIGYRTWAIGGTPPSGWQTKATDVDGAAVGDGSVTPKPYPFSLTPAVPGVSTLQQITLTVTAGNTLPGNTTLATVGFVAKNSYQSATNADLNVAGTSDTPVCSPTGVRP